MYPIRINREALERARKQFCLDTCLEWQQYLNNPGEKCYLQKTVYGQERYPASPGARKYVGNDAFFKAIMCLGQLFLSVDEQIYDWVEETFRGCQPEWFCEYENLRRIDEKLREYGRKVADTHVYFLPEEASAMQETETKNAVGFVLEWFEAEEILCWRENNRFQRALGFSATQPDMIAVAAMKAQGRRMEQDNMAGMAGVSMDGEYLWQIGIDVISEYEGRGLAADLVRRLKEEVLRRGRIPFYGTSESHTVSQTVALKAGFVPAWTEIYVKPL